MKKIINIFSFACIVSILLFSFVISPNQVGFGQNIQASDTEEVAGVSTMIEEIRCDQTEQLEFHNHTLLLINDKDDSISVPGGIGIIPGECLFWLHTHDDSGIIHIEAPINSKFTLGQFFRIWEEFDSSQIVEQISNNKIPANTTMILENNETVSVENYRDIVLRDNLVIIIDLLNRSKY